MLPQRPFHTPAPARKSGSVTLSPAAPYEVAKRRVLAKLEDRLDMSASKRMPASLLRQSIRQHAEQVVDQETRGFAKPDRDRLVDEVLGELLGYGPLEELFADPGVREVMVTGPATVIARREHGQWLPTSVKFRDEAHVRATFDRIATHAEPVGPVMASVTLFDMRLPNGFRGLAVIPPDALDQPATASFVREKTIPVPVAPAKDGSGVGPAVPPKPSPGSVTASPRPGSGTVTMAPPRVPAESSASGIGDPLARHRARVLERLLSKLAALKVYDVSRLDITELRRAITAYISEYVEVEKIYLSDADQGRLMLEILTALQR